MKKKLSLSIALLFVMLIANGQVDKARECVNSFLVSIQNADYEKAYSLLDDEAQKKESQDEFELYFTSLKQYYGKLKDFKCDINNSICFSGEKEDLYALYKMKFSNTEATISIKLKLDQPNSFKVDSYFVFRDYYDGLPVFDKMAKVALKHVKKGEYESLYELMQDSYLYDSYEEFLADIKKLEVDGKMKYQQKSDDILVYDDKVDINIAYEVNEIGDITFEYTREDGQIELTGISLYFTKEIEEAYQANLSKFIDTTSLLKEKEVLTAEDSTLLKEEFDRIQEEKRKSELDKLLSESLFSDAESETSVSIAYDWNQLEEDDQALIKGAAEKYLEKLAQNDINGFWEMCHPKFKESTPFSAFSEVGEIIANMITSTDSLSFIDAKKVVYSTPPKTSKFTTGGSVDKSNPTYLQFYTLAGIENQVLTLYELANTPLSKTITMKFGLEDSTYKLTRFDINTSSIEGKDEDYFVDLAKKWESKESSFPKFIALNMAYRLSYLGRGTSTSQMISITEELKTLQQDADLISEVKKWSVNDSIYDIINVDFLETKNDVTPNIIYVSKVKLGETSTEKEVKVLFQYFQQKYPDLVQEFERFMFTAYEDYPAVRTKEYELFRVLMDINEIDESK